MRPRPTNPEPSSAIETGSGTAVVLALLVKVNCTALAIPFCELVASVNMPVVASEKFIASELPAKLTNGFEV